MKSSLAAMTQTRSRKNEFQLNQSQLEQIFKKLFIQGKGVEEEGTYSRFMNFVKEFGVDVLLSTVFRMG